MAGAKDGVAVPSIPLSPGVFPFRGTNGQVSPAATSSLARHAVIINSAACSAAASPGTRRRGRSRSRWRRYSRMVKCIVRLFPGHFKLVVATTEKRKRGDGKLVATTVTKSALAHDFSPKLQQKMGQTGHADGTARADEAHRDCHHLKYQYKDDRGSQTEPTRLETPQEEWVNRSLPLVTAEILKKLIHDNA